LQNADTLVWYWGRRGGPARMTYDLLPALRRHLDGGLYVSLSRQSELFAATASLGIPGLHIDTFSDPVSAVTRSLRFSKTKHEFIGSVRQLKAPVALSMMRHVWTPFTAAALRAAGVRVIEVLHDASPHPGESCPLWKRHLALSLRSTDGIVTLSNHVRDQVIAQYGYPGDRIWHVPHASLSYATWNGPPRRLPTDRPIRLLFFGRLLCYKGLALLAKAYLEIAQFLPVTLHVAGFGKSTGLEPLTGRSDVTIENRWVPETEVGSLLQSADVLLAPYSEASQSGVVPCAYAAGLPVVATPVGGLREQVRDGVTGVRATRHEAPAFAAAIAQLIADPNLYSRCSAGALKASSCELSISNMSLSLTRAVREIAVRPKRDMSSQRGTWRLIGVGVRPLRTSVSQPGPPEP